MCLVLLVHTQAHDRQFKEAVTSWLYMRIINMIYDIILNTSHYTHTLTCCQNVDFSVPIPISHSLDIISTRVYSCVHHTHTCKHVLFLFLSLVCICDYLAERGAIPSLSRFVWVRMRLYLGEREGGRRVWVYPGTPGVIVSTLIPGFSVHMYTRALFLTLSNTLSFSPTTQKPKERWGRIVINP